MPLLRLLYLWISLATGPLATPLGSPTTNNHPQSPVQPPKTANCSIKDCFPSKQQPPPKHDNTKPRGINTKSPSGSEVHFYDSFIHLQSPHDTALKPKRYLINQTSTQNLVNGEPHPKHPPTPPPPRSKKGKSAPCTQDVPMARLPIFGPLFSQTQWKSVSTPRESADREGNSINNHNVCSLLHLNGRRSRKRLCTLPGALPAASPIAHAGSLRRSCVAAASKKRPSPFPPYIPLCTTPVQIPDHTHGPPMSPPHHHGKHSPHPPPITPPQLLDPRGQKGLRTQRPRRPTNNTTPAPSPHYIQKWTDENTPRPTHKRPPAQKSSTPLCSARMPNNANTRPRKSPKTSLNAPSHSMELERDPSSEITREPLCETPFDAETDDLNTDYHALVIFLEEEEGSKNLQQLSDDFAAVPNIRRLTTALLGDRNAVIISFATATDLEHAIATARHTLGSYQRYQEALHNPAAFQATVGRIPIHLRKDRDLLGFHFERLNGLISFEISPPKGRAFRAFLTFKTVTDANRARALKCVAISDFTCPIEAPFALEPEDESPRKKLYIHGLPAGRAKAEILQDLFRKLSVQSYKVLPPHRGRLSIEFSLRSGPQAEALIGRKTTLMGSQVSITDNPDPRLPQLPTPAQDAGLAPDRALLDAIKQCLLRYHSPTQDHTPLTPTITVTKLLSEPYTRPHKNNSPPKTICCARSSARQHPRNKLVLDYTSLPPAEKAQKQGQPILRHRESLLNPQPSNYGKDGPHPQTPTLKIASWNVRGSGGPLTRARITNHIREYDIFLLQEIHSPRGQELDIWNRSLKYRRRWAPGSTYRAGVAIYTSPHTPNLEIVDNHTVHDPEGHFLAITVKWYDQLLRIISVYLPTNPAQRTAKLEQMWGDPSIWLPGTVVMGGDFNTCLDPQKDSTGYSGTFLDWSSSNPHLEQLLTTHDLLDSWRTLNPEQRAYTWNRSIASPQKSRLDRIYISRALQPLLVDAEIRHTPASISDHYITGASIKCPADIFIHKPSWKFNKELTLNSRWRKSVSHALKSYIAHLDSAQSPDPDSPIQTYARFKLYLKNKCKRHSIAVATTQKLQEEQTSRRMLAIQAKLGNASPESKGQLIAELQQGNALLEAISRARAESARIRSRATFCEEGEESSKYFFNMEKFYANRKSIYQLRRSDGTLTATSRDTMARAQEFYTELYAPKPTTEKAMDKILTPIDSKVPPDHPLHSAPIMISEQEVLRAIKSLPLGKAPGQDGLTAEFYKAFPEEMAKILTHTFNKALALGRLPETLTQCTICLLHKKGDMNDLSNWRPISLLNTDYKILAHVVNERLKPLLEHCIAPDQHGFIPGRKREDPIAYCLHTMRHCIRTQQEGSLLFLDQEKAFDRVDRQYMAKTLDSYNIPPNVRDWVALIYSDTPANININNQLSTKIQLMSGVRQGCPLSPALFALTIEPMANAIRKNTSIRGISIPKGTAKIQMFADDTIFYCGTPGDVPRIIETLQLYSEASGAKPNLSKTEILPIGPERGGYIDYSPIKTLKYDTHVKLLGVQVANQPDDEKIWTPQAAKIMNLVQLWSRRNVSTIGKLTLIKQLMLSLIWHHTDIHNPPEHVLKQIDAAIWPFFNSGRRAQISKEKASLPRHQGGYGFPDIRASITAQRTHWVYDLIIHQRDKVWYDLACNELDLLSGSPGLGPDITRLPNARLSSDTHLTFWKKNIQSFRKANFPTPQPSTRDEHRALHLTELGNRANSLLRSGLTRVGDLTFAEAVCQPPKPKPIPQLNLPKRIPKRPLSDLTEKVAAISTCPVELPQNFKVHHTPNPLTPSVYRTVPFSQSNDSFLAKRATSTPRGRNAIPTSSPPRQFDARHASIYQISVIDGKTLGRTDKMPLSSTIPPTFPTKKKQDRVIYNQKIVYDQLTRCPYIQHYHARFWDEILPGADWASTPNRRPFAGLPKYIDRLRMQIMHGSLPIGPNARYRNATATPDSPDATLCPVCGTTETVQHRFLECQPTQTLWKILQLTWKEIAPGEGEIPMQTMIFGPSYRGELDYNHQAIADLLCGFMIKIIWDERKSYFDHPTKSPTNMETLIGTWLWRVSNALNTMVAARRIFAKSKRRWFRLHIPRTATFTASTWPAQLRQLLSSPLETPPPRGQTDITKTTDPRPEGPPTSGNRPKREGSPPRNHSRNLKRKLPPQEPP